MTNLSVNLNKVALLRNQRTMSYPSVVEMAKIVLAAGAHGITVHPRPDARHIRTSDVRDVAAMMRSQYGPEIEFNVEGNPTDEFLELVAEVRPDQVTLVPDDPNQSTSDHGWQIPEHAERLNQVVPALKSINARVALFLDADPAMVPAAKAVGADRIELYTGPYGMAFGGTDQAAELEKCRLTTEAVAAAGLGMNAGHDLNLDNLPTLIAAAPAIAEVSIGHAITADALIHGFAVAVAKYLDALSPTILAANQAAGAGAG